jgi:thiol:disulfide interchange protein
MKKILTVIAVMIFAFGNSFAQTKEEKFEVYHPDSNVVNEYANALMKAANQNKNVLLLIGGNWCKWCRIFDKFTKSDHEIDSTMNANYVVVHVNYSKENKNLPFLETLEYPQRFGFPVFVVVNPMGTRIHTQNSWYLESPVIDKTKDKEGYDKEKVLAFLKNWSVAALDPKIYEDKEVKK